MNCPSCDRPMAGLPANAFEIKEDDLGALVRSMFESNIEPNDVFICAWCMQAFEVKVPDATR